MEHAADTVRRWNPRWTEDELVESFEELAELERLADGVAGDEPLDAAGLELIATLERADPVAARSLEASRASALGSEEPRPELDLLVALAAYAMRDDVPAR